MPLRGPDLTLTVPGAEPGGWTGPKFPGSRSPGGRPCPFPEEFGATTPHAHLQPPLGSPCSVREPAVPAGGTVALASPTPPPADLPSHRSATGGHPILPRDTSQASS